MPIDINRGFFRDRAGIQYFKQHKIMLHTHNTVFQSIILLKKDSLLLYVA